MKCTNCGNLNSSDSMFCTECGQSLGSNTTGGHNISNELSKAYNYFSRKADVYDNLFRMNSVVNCTPAKYKIWVFLVCAYVISAAIPQILGAPMAIMSIESGDIDQMVDIFATVVLALIIGGIAAFILIRHIRKVKNSRKNIENAKIEISRIGKELYDYYKAYGNCPVSFENSQPVVLYKLCEIAQNGRAFTINDALRVYNEDCYRIGMNNSQNDLILNSVYSMYNNYNN